MKIDSISGYEICAENCTGCMRCQLICSYKVNKTFGYDLARIRIKRVGFEEEYDVSFSEECNRCGLCLQYCTYNAICKPQNASSIG